MSYEPKPIDTSGVVLEDDIIRLIELLARNNHEIWAAQRVAEGWSYGLRRDDEAKRHPCLVSYDELPESEKAYDRNIVLGMLKAIVKIGFHIEPKHMNAGTGQ